MHVCIVTWRLLSACVSACVFSNSGGYCLLMFNARMLSNLIVTVCLFKCFVFSNSRGYCLLMRNARMFSNVDSYCLLMYDARMFSNFDCYSLLVYVLVF
jgi:hypothetical protein